jgi:hypothetical protein
LELTQGLSWKPEIKNENVRMSDDRTRLGIGTDALYIGIMEGMYVILK